MDALLLVAIITITLALVFYTIGVFGERRARILKKSHVFIFWMGFIFDTIGTTTMSQLAKSMGGADTTQLLHGITGVLAIVLMLFHASWASWVLYKNDEQKKRFFHKFSIVVWAIWLVPYLVGMYIGMTQ